MKEQYLPGGSVMAYNADCTTTYTSNPFIHTGNAVGMSGTSAGTHITNTIISDTLSLTNNINNMNRVQNHFVAIFKIERNDKTKSHQLNLLKRCGLKQRTVHQ